MDVRIVEVPELEPGCCMLSRTSEGPFIDTGVDIEDLDPLGRIYLAESTISNIAQTLGFAPPVAAQRQRDRITELETQLAEALATVEGLIAANAALTAAGYTAPEAPLVVPAGSEQDVLLWVGEPGDDLPAVLTRAEAARDAELLEQRPRPALVTELESYLSLKEALA